MIKRICEECGTEFEIYPSNKQKFCSEKCGGLAQSKRQVGKNNPCWRGGIWNKEHRKKYNEKYCEEHKEIIKNQRKEYREKLKNKVYQKHYQQKYREINYEVLKKYDKQKYHNRLKNNICISCGKKCANKFFCNNICRGKEQSKRQLGKDNPAWKGKIQKLCAGCGKVFFVPPCCKNQKCCSNGCKGLSKVGTNNPNWKNGATSLNHKIRDLRDNKIWRILVFERDKYTCAICDKVGGDLEAHHINSFTNILLKNKITSIKGAKKCKELWDINNGITVCTSCHTLVDKHRFVGNNK